MLNPVPEYILERIRRPSPGNLEVVVPGSTPVVSFGNAQTARIATLGLNPSRVEFLDAHGSLFDGPERRLATHTSLGTSDLARAPLTTVLQLLEDCNSYFQRRPYRRWFDQLMPMLGACGASYYDGTACHLDLVQWATDPTWQNLPRDTRRQLIGDDAEFLTNQIRSERFGLMLVNGMGALNELRGTLGAALELQEVEPIEDLAVRRTRVFTGTIFERVRVVGWSTNIQSSFGVTSGLRSELARRASRGG